MMPITLVRATRAEIDEPLLKSWMRSLNSTHSQRNFAVTARRFLAELPEGGLRAATVEDVRDGLAGISAGLSEASARQYVLRIKSLLGYAHAQGYTPFNAGATIKVRSDAGSRGAHLAKRIMSEVEVGLLIRAAPSKRDRVLLEVIYAGGLRVSETVALAWADVLPRDNRVQLSILGKGGKLRQVLLPDVVSRSLLTSHGDARQRSCLRQPQGRPPDRAPSTAWSSERPARPASTRLYRRTGCVTRTARTLSTAGPRCPRCSRPLVTATSPPRAAICTRALTARAASSSIQECFFDDEG